MGFFGKIFKNKQIVTIVALIACFAILIFAYRYRVDKAINAVSVPVAKKRLEARQLIDESCFETKKVASSMLTSNVITNTSELLGGENVPAKYVNYNTFIPEGSLFYRSAVTTWDKMPDSPWADIKDGYTMYSLKLDANSNPYGNAIYPGDVIDLYVSGRDQNGKYFIGPLIKSIQVLAVKDGNGNHIFRRSAEQESAAALIFAVENEKFLFLNRAQEVFGTILAVPSGASSKGIEATTEIESAYIESYVFARSKESTDDAQPSKGNIKVTD